MAGQGRRKTLPRGEGCYRWATACSRSVLELVGLGEVVAVALQKDQK